jgi:indolepyruvate ferredoxin oxidoreductase
VLRLFRLLAGMKGLRGTPFDPFGYSADRRVERRLIAAYESDLEAILRAPAVDPATALELAELPLKIRGYGPVKAEAIAAAEVRRAALLARLGAGPEAVAAE